MVYLLTIKKEFKSRISCFCHCSCASGCFSFSAIEIAMKWNLNSHLVSFLAREISKQLLKLTRVRNINNSLKRRLNSSLIKLDLHQILVS